MNCLLVGHWRYSVIAGVCTRRNEKSMVVVGVASGYQMAQDGSVRAVEEEDLRST